MYKGKPRPFSGKRHGFKRLSPAKIMHSGLKPG